MQDDRFWQLIQAVSDLPQDERAKRIEEILTKSPESEVLGFEDRLQEILSVLASPAHSAACGLVGDSFLRVRCAVVLSGPSKYAEVVQAPPSIVAFNDNDAGDLVSVARRAYESVTTGTWDNPHAVDAVQSGAVDEQWVSLASLLALGEDLGAEYELSWSGIVEALWVAPQWRSWWQRSGKRCLDVTVSFTGETTATTKLRKGRNAIRVGIERPSHDFASPPSTAERQQASDAIESILTDIAAELDLLPLPEFPDLPTITKRDIEKQQQSKKVSDDIAKAAAKIAQDQLRENS